MRARAFSPTLLIKPQLLHASQTIGVGQLVRTSCNAVETQKGSQRHPLFETILSGQFIALSIIPDLMTDATNRDPCPRLSTGCDSGYGVV